jgi:hypothetical protein
VQPRYCSRVCDLKMQDQEWGFCLLPFKQKYVNTLRETIAKWLHCHQYSIRPWRHHARSMVTNRYLHLHSIQIHTIWCNWVQCFLASKPWFLAQFNFLLIILCLEFWDCWKLKVETFHPAFYIGCPFLQVPVSLWAFKKCSSSLLHFFISYIKAAAAMEVSYDWNSVAACMWFVVSSLRLYP